MTTKVTTAYHQMTQGKISQSAETVQELLRELARTLDNHSHMDNDYETEMNILEDVERTIRQAKNAIYNHTPH